jgi:hypothetical protein
VRLLSEHQLDVGRLARRMLVIDVDGMRRVQAAHRFDVGRDVREDVS